MMMFNSTSSVGASTQRLRRAVVGAALLAVTCLSLGATASSASTSKHHCITPDGVDLNTVYGVSEAIVAPFCTQVPSGEKWTVTTRWFMAPTFQIVPAGFVPTGATPIEDFIAKFLGVKYVLDPGTKHEKVYVFTKTSRLWSGVSPAGFPFVNTLTLGTLSSLSIGEHFVSTYWSFSAMHCDGLGDVVGTIEGGSNCILPGDTLYRTDVFEVVAS